LAILVTVHIESCSVFDYITDNNCDYQLYRLKYSNVVLL
jgi:hypothetical protein